MNRITATEALTKVGRLTKYAPLRNEILNLAPGEAIEIGFDEYKPTAITQVVANAARGDGTRKFSVRKRRDGEACFVICSAPNN
jgi:hypothetical protein